MASRGFGAVEELESGGNLFLETFLCHFVLWENHTAQRRDSSVFRLDHLLLWRQQLQQGIYDFAL